MVVAPALLVGVIVIFIVIYVIVLAGLFLIFRWRAGNSRLSDKKLNDISVIIALIITAVVFDQISSRGTTATGIILLYGLTGLGIIVGLISFISSKSSSKSNLRNKSQAMPLSAQNIPKEPTKEAITQTMNYEGQLVYIIGESTDELSLFQCPVCGQIHAVSKEKENFIFDCSKCSNTIQITRRHVISNSSEGK